MVSVCFMQRILTIALLLLSLAFLGQAQVESFSCGAAVAYSNVSDAGCQKGCCTSSSCCQTPRTAKTPPVHSSGSQLVNLDWFQGTLPLGRLVLVLPAAIESVEPCAAARYAPPILATNCVRLI